MEETSRTSTVPQDADSRGDTGALRRGFAVLEALLESAHPMTSRDVAAAVKLSDSTTHRLLQTLCETGHVVRDGARRYHVAAKALLPLTIYHPLNVLRRDAFMPLCALRDEFGVSASIVVLAGSERLVLDVIGVTGSLAPYYGTRLDNPLHVSASGKLLLLSLPAKERDAALGKAPYVRLTPKTITTRKELMTNLDAAARNGFATNLDENFIGFGAMAAPLLLGPDRVVGSIVLTGSTERFAPARIEGMGASLKSCAQLISSGSPSVRGVHAMFGTAR
ncbi:MAG: IclR family transcriptional regulator C-terminal domain-containing protein [Hyphomicrobiaceae bacterium]